MEVGDVVRGVSRRIGDLHPEDRLAAAEHVNVLLRHRQDLAPQVVQPVAIKPLSTGQQLRRIDQVRRPPLVDVDLEVRPPSDQCTGGSSVVQVDMRQQDRTGLLIANRIENRLERRLRTRINERPFHLPTTDDVGAAQMHHVNNAHPRQLMGVGGGVTGPSPLLSGDPSPDYLKR
jgi:hypothetical protein